MWFRRYRYYVVMLVVGMHIGIVFTMNIFFEASTYMLILLGLPWGGIFDWGYARLSGAERRQAAATT